MANDSNLISNLQSNLFSTVFDVLSDPVVGWVDTILGLSAGSDFDFTTLQGDLTTMQTELSLLGPELSKLATELTSFDAFTSAQNALTPIVSAVDAYQVGGTGSGAAATPARVPGNLIESSMGGWLSMINEVLTPPTAGVPDSGQSTTRGLLGQAITQLTPRFTTDAMPCPSAAIQKSTLALLQDFLAYYANQQMVLLTMMVEACHQGQSVGTQIDATDHSGSIPPNYADAGGYLDAYNRHVAQQNTFLPFPITGIGYRGTLDGLGCDQTVLDNAPPASSSGQAPFAWATQNVRNPKTGSSNINLAWVQNVLNVLNSPDAWMLRLPTWDELTSLPTTVTTGFYSEACFRGEQWGFDIEIDVADSNLPNPISFPFIAQEALDQSNWSSSTDNSYGYTDLGCGWFYDLRLQAQAIVHLYFTEPVSVSDFFSGNLANTALVGVAINCDDQSASSSGAPGGDNIARATIDDYMDVIFIYRFPLIDVATSVETDPAVEEPSSIGVTAPATAPTMQMSAYGNFSRLNKTAQGPHTPGPQNYQLDITNDVCWTAPDTTFATIDPNTGLLTWVAPGLCTVYAIRGPLSASTAVQSPVGFQEVARVVKGVNIYPREIQVDHISGETVTVNIEVLYTDGSTDPVTDGTATNNLCTFTSSSDTFPPTSTTEGSTTPNGFAVPSGSLVGTFTITGSFNSGQFTDSATVTII